jgi:hypothetical protein
MEYKNIYVITMGRFASQWLPWLLNENTLMTQFKIVDESGIHKLFFVFFEKTYWKSTPELNLRFDAFEEVEYQHYLVQFFSWFAVEIGLELPEGIANSTFPLIAILTLF